MVVSDSAPEHRAEAVYHQLTERRSSGSECHRLRHRRQQRYHISGGVLLGLCSLALFLLSQSIPSSSGVLLNGTDGALDSLADLISSNDVDYVNANNDDDGDDNVSSNNYNASTDAVISSATGSDRNFGRRPNSGGGRNRPVPIYLNEFAVYIPSGPDVATVIADKYGFTNFGQVRSVQINLRGFTVYEAGVFFERLFVIVCQLAALRGLFIGSD